MLRRSMILTALFTLACGGDGASRQDAAVDARATVDVGAAGNAGTGTAGGGAAGSTGGAPGVDASADAGGANAGAPGHDASATDGPSVTDGGRADVLPATCNNLVNGATVITNMRFAAEAPPAMGGTIKPGRYFRTGGMVFTGPGGATGPDATDTHKTTLEIKDAATGFELQFVAKEKAFPEIHASATALPNMKDLVLTYTCPASLAAVLNLRFTAMGNTLTVFTPVANGTEVATYTRQP